MGENQELKAPIILKVVCFFIPLAGLIIYACNISKNRKYANSCGIASLVGLLTPIIIVIIIVVSGGIYNNSLKDNTIFTSSQSVSAEEQNEIEQRLDLIYSLKRKYGNDIKEIIQYKNEIQEEIEHIENLDEYNNKLKKELKELKVEMTKLAEQINKLRNINGKKLSNSINEVLEQLEMKNAKINIHIDYKEEFFENGRDEVEFYIRTNLGEDEKQLSKIASGGEMSRIMLAIKKVLADTDKIPVLVFDEIDTGISGKAANSVAEKLNGISKNHQVLCISHLPSIAAIADFNYFISKKICEERTSTNVKLLDEDEIIREIARISSGEINDATIKYAMQLRNKRVS